MKTAIIWGVTGQDGSYMADLLLSKNYSVIGVKRRTSTDNTQNISHLLNTPSFTLVEGDIVDPSSVNSIISKYKTDECYNLACQSHVGTSFSQPSYSLDVAAKGPILILEAITDHSPHTRFYQASTSEMFGSNYSTRFVGNDEENMYLDSTRLDKDFEKYQNETTPFSPNSPYAIAKVAAHHSVRMYREAYGIFACAGILFNHESERRGTNFVTRKITKYVAKLNKYLDSGIDWVSADGMEKGRKRFGEFPKLKLGNIDAVRDWGYAPDYIEAMWLMLQQDKPDDFVIGTGEGHSVKDFLIEAFSYIGEDCQKYVQIDSSLYRPSEVSFLRCEADKAQNVLKWKPKVDFSSLVKRMVAYDLNNG